MVDEEVIDDETKLSQSEKDFISTLSKESLLSSLSFDELVEELRRKYHTLLSRMLEQVEGEMAVAKVNPTTYTNQEAEQ